ncbi:MAG: ADP-glyceromanno-heptose 6-epimerase [Flavobacteriales bacterium TMED113]|nr:MAG: ADP-glyceromanno-heptose 6-epimerase [Flavobacteriales bacterium TMED113]
MIIITGSSGFIAGALIRKLVLEKIKNIVICDFENQNLNQSGLTFIETHKLFSFIDSNKNSINVIYHLGAITDTTFTDEFLLNKYNLEFSIILWNHCVKYSIPIIYASSAATYGDGYFGFNDNHNNIENLTPLNLYAKSKNDFDNFVLNQIKTPPYWFGLKFFNVFGFDESKKKNMSSIVYQSYNKIIRFNKMYLFKSYNKNYKDGYQERDFIYIDDVVNVLIFLINNKNSGIYNLGTGESTTFIKLIRLVFRALKIKENIKFVEMPNNLKEKYQYSTKADMSKLRSIGYHYNFQNISSAVNDYILNYLAKKN